MWDVFLNIAAGFGVTVFACLLAVTLLAIWTRRRPTPPRTPPPEFDANTATTADDLARYRSNGTHQ
ncbi:hypothetical protein [Sphaerisporangium sp. TRM90804]|uniref:hypothetical protein n=1 Tax=Sphaerisporangium sp. TRM90804 TaxID=3031113 RepID=UPI0024498214|nr:hypothetical protein [Sphaerisporangium sp. TRM90804]MDH2424823.1 hypothetical protein [Sphaerisporangium sp. TRM90804]